MTGRRPNPAPGLACKSLADFEPGLDRQWAAQHAAREAGAEFVRVYTHPALWGGEPVFSDMKEYARGMAEGYAVAMKYGSAATEESNDRRET